MYQEIIKILEKNNSNLCHCTVVGITLLSQVQVVVYQTNPRVDAYGGGLPTDRVAVMDYNGRVIQDLYLSSPKRGEV